MALQSSEILSEAGFYHDWETWDFDEQADLLLDWNQHYKQITSGNFNGYISEMKFEDVHIFLEYTSHRLFEQGYLAQDIIAVGVPMAAGGPSIFCGVANNNEYMHMFSGQNGFEFFSASKLLIAGISIKRAALFDTLTGSEQELVQKNCQLAHLVRLDQRYLAAIRQFITEIFHTIRATPALLHIPQFTAFLRASLLELLADSLTQDTDNIMPPFSTERSLKIVTACREQFLSRAADPISIAELCKQLGISRRTLHNCFHNSLGISPVAYLRTERLNAARHMLKDVKSVTEAATHWGFWHFGHFSQEYKKMFGELPSTTFKRLHPPGKALVSNQLGQKFSPCHFHPSTQRPLASIAPLPEQATAIF